MIFLEGGICHIVIYPGDSGMLSPDGFALPVLIIAFSHSSTKSLLLTILQENKKEVRISISVSHSHC